MTKYWAATRKVIGENEEEKTYIDSSTLSLTRDEVERKLELFKFECPKLNKERPVVSVDQYTLVKVTEAEEKEKTLRCNISTLIFPENCVCNKSDWCTAKSSPQSIPQICNEFVPFSETDNICIKCEHDRECHIKENNVNRDN